MSFWGANRAPGHDSEGRIGVVGGVASGGPGYGRGSPDGGPSPGVVTGGRGYDGFGFASLGRRRVEGGGGGSAILVDPGQESDRALGLIEEFVAAPEELDAVLVLGQGGTQGGL